MAVIQFPSGDVRQGSLIELDGQRVWFPRPILITGRMEDGTEHAEVSFSSKPVLVALVEAESRAFESWPECLPRDVHLVLRRHDSETAALSYLAGVHDAGRAHPNIGACCACEQNGEWFTMALRRTAADAGGGIVFVAQFPERGWSESQEFLVDRIAYRTPDGRWITASDEATAESAFICLMED